MRVGVPHSVFTGRTVTAGEPWWLPEDTEAVIGWVALERASCSGCGHPRSETLDPDNFRRYRAEAWTCAGCWEKARAEKDFDGDAKGLMVQVLPPE